MQVEKFPLVKSNSYESIINDYLTHQSGVSDLINGFPDEQNFAGVIGERKFDSATRTVLADTLSAQYSGLDIHDAVIRNIGLLRKDNTFTVTTGHQLCLYTGPLYFIYKIISAIRLSERLNKKFPDKNIVPVYWMASEDHDFEEVNHAFLFGNKIVWNSDQKGAVGSFTPNPEVISMFEAACGNTLNGNQITGLIKSAYSQPTLADAIRYLINEMFGKYGLIIIDGSEKNLKACFKDGLRNELFAQKGYSTVSNTNLKLKDRNYKIQVNPREINLFYLSQGARERIEKNEHGQWKIGSSNRVYSADEMEQMVDQTPEKLSPNVIVRPMYQESVLPNIAYVGGPGEIAYWMQLKSFFDSASVQFPILVLRDSAMLISAKGKQRLEKAGLTTDQIFIDRSLVLKQVLQSDATSFEHEKQRLAEVFQSLSEKVSAVDITLETAAKAELQRNLNSIDVLEKKMLRALKTKEEIKISHIDKLWDEIYPDGSQQERHDNYFQFAANYEGDLIADLMPHFDPLAAEMKVMFI